MKVLFVIKILLISSVLQGQNTVTYESHNLPIANPERGWFFSVGAWSNNALQPFPSREELDSMRLGADKITLLRRYYLLDDYAESPIAQSILDEFQKNCDSLRSAGYKLIPRFTYNFSESLAQDDATVDWTHFHLNQLQPFFESNEDVIAHVEAGFIGHYGEWHNSSNEHVDNFTLEVLDGGHQILDSLLKVVPEDRMVATRYFYWNKMEYLEEYHGTSSPLNIENAFNGSVASRLGSHHDAVMNEEDWMWHPAFVNEQIVYANEDLKWVVSSGEPLPDEYTLSNNPIPELSALYFNSLAVNANNESTNAHYDYWKTEGYFDEMTLNLGYRYSMIEATVEDSVNPGDLVNIDLSIENTGYSAPYNYRKTEIVLRNTQSLEEYHFDLTETNDMRFWHTGAHQLDLSFQLPVDFNTGSYSVFLNFPDSDMDLSSNPAYSVQLANVGTWEETFGYNSMLFEITVGGLLNTIEHQWKNEEFIYPNPANDHVFITSASKWTLLDASGKLLESGYGDQVSLEKYNSGLYLLNFGNKLLKIIKK